MTITYKNGEIESIGCYVKNKKEGLWKYYSSCGKVKREEYWKNDFEVGYRYFEPPLNPIGPLFKDPN